MKVVITLKKWDETLHDWIPREITFQRVGQQWQSYDLDTKRFVLELSSVEV